MKIFLTTSTKHLTRSLLRHGLQIGKVDPYFFADGERGYLLKDNIRKKATTIIASVLPDPESLFELLALQRLLAENGSSEITLVMPYLAYARQDRATRKGEAGIGNMVAGLIRTMKVSRRIVVDVHSDLIRHALGSRVTEISALPLFAEVLSEHPPDVIVAPDSGSVARTRKMSGLLLPRPEIAFIEKFRPRFNVAVSTGLRGEVRDKDVVVLDDMIDTGGTLAGAINLISRQKARSVRVAATHGIFSRNARERLARLPVDDILITNTLPQIPHRKICVLDIVPLLAKALE